MSNAEDQEWLADQRWARENIVVLVERTLDVETLGPDDPAMSRVLEGVTNLFAQATDSQHGALVVQLALLCRTLVYEGAQHSGETPHQFFARVRPTPDP